MLRVGDGVGIKGPRGGPMSFITCPEVIQLVTMASATLLSEPLLDPSELFRPEPVYEDLHRHDHQSTQKKTKEAHEFRVFPEDEESRVRLTYYSMHTCQTVSSVRERMLRWTKFDHFKCDALTALRRLSDLVDESDPDVDVPNIMHAFQTAEGIRKAHPDKPWFHLVGLLHDLGKVMAFWGEPQWAVVGDTFPVGCGFAYKGIAYGEDSFRGNPDVHDDRYNTKYGMYKPNCGLDNVMMSWGHDEYMYRVLIHNKTTIPKEGLYMVRFHSFYPWHASGEYMHLCNQEDIDMLQWVTEFNKFDLYTKSEEEVDMESLVPYYQGLLDQYLPGELEW